VRWLNFLAKIDGAASQRDKRYPTLRALLDRKPHIIKCAPYLCMGENTLVLIGLEAASRFMISTSFYTF
jgi:hypothetical protein